MNYDAGGHGGLEMVPIHHYHVLYPASHGYEMSATPMPTPIANPYQYPRPSSPATGGQQYSRAVEPLEELINLYEQMIAREREGKGETWAIASPSFEVERERVTTYFSPSRAPHVVERVMNETFCIPYLCRILSSAAFERRRKNPKAGNAMLYARRSVFFGNRV
ncbi:hypothetical protein BCR34DRAFT_259135 [Clohesyomyces aquaticus]|uniref:Uncharacterized protein n=1 Tax=Clohesyomyces aquaticus TaxID=1231657 RepID=A0A1Y2A8X1_9PLEO|nr:hypothetical protein BCR34DRAFT_259135 [Clohesyomyces aquaticus]